MTKEQSSVQIYTTRTCPYCVRAKQLLTKKNIQFEEVDVSDDPDLRLALVEKANGRKTVPQIFINSTHVGGCDDLYALHEKNELDQLLFPAG